MIIQIIIALLLFVSGVVVLTGKGDKLIAGYNTASKEEREKVNIKRLRLLTGGLLIVMAPLCFILNNNVYSGLTFTGIVVVLTLIVVVLANTWAMKK